MAHLVEHLTFDQSVDSQLLTTRLANVASYFNAETTLDATTFISRARPAHLDDLLAMAPSFDTVGWLTRDRAVLAACARVEHVVFHR